MSIRSLSSIPACAVTVPFTVSIYGTNRQHHLRSVTITQVQDLRRERNPSRHSPTIPTRFHENIWETVKTVMFYGPVVLPEAKPTSIALYDLFTHAPSSS